MKKGIFGVIAGLMLVTGLTGCGSQSSSSSSSSSEASSSESVDKDYDKAMKDANQAIEDKNFSQANKDINQALKYKENDQQAENIQHQLELYQTASKDYNDGDFAAAKKSAQALVQSDGSETMMNYGKDLLNNINKQVQARDKVVDSEENAYAEKAAQQVAADKANMNRAVRVMTEDELKQNKEYAQLLKQVEKEKAQDKTNNDKVTVIEAYSSKSGQHGVVEHNNHDDIDDSKTVKHYIVDKNGNVKEITETSTDDNGHHTEHETESSYHE